MISSAWVLLPTSVWFLQALSVRGLQDPLVGVCGQRTSAWVTAVLLTRVRLFVALLTASGRLRAHHCRQDGARQCCRSAPRSSPALPATRPRGAADGAATATCRQVILQINSRHACIPQLPSPSPVRVSLPAVHASATRQGIKVHPKHHRTNQQWGLAVSTCRRATHNLLD